MSLVEDDYEMCAKLEKIPELGWIPSSGYLGVTAATGGLSDDHDVLSFSTYTLVPLEERKEEVGDWENCARASNNERFPKLIKSCSHFIPVLTLEAGCKANNGKLTTQSRF